jgi:hypothetical protein
MQIQTEYKPCSVRMKIGLSTDNATKGTLEIKSELGWDNLKRISVAIRVGASDSQPMPI